ncbi:FAD-linked oxidoreductase [Aureobasidium sp. EXF-10727]|nr:FAD-linked oxidoreductase [Aureobasidium sp. EXF-10727]
MNVTRHSLNFPKNTLLPGQIHTIWKSSRHQSSLVSRHSNASAVDDQKHQPSQLHRISTVNLIRNIVLGKVFTSPFLFKYGVACLSKIANSRSAILDPDKNALLRALIKPMIYDHFCAGTNKLEIKGTLAYLKNMGFKGVILIYSREIPAMPVEELHELEPLIHDEDIDIWRDGNVRTLDMVEPGDYVGIKFTGAGPRVAQALAQDRDPPQQLVDAMSAICERAAAQGSRVWIDAEQQVFQSTIDRWTVDMMRLYNKNGEALVSLTLQAYLKSARSTLERLLKQAHDENWTLGIKLILIELRGAYIGSETRTLIHDIKTQTDECYDSIAADLLTKSFPGFSKHAFPNVELFLAGHNSDSIRKAYALYQGLLQQGDTPPPIKFGQLLGMADDISCELLAMGDKEAAQAAKKSAAPMVYKCMNWGSVRECMHYLVRRATENQSAAQRMQSTVGVMQKELRRRMGV